MVPAPHRAPEHQRQEEAFPQNLAMKISGDTVRLRKRDAVDLGILLKGPSSDSLTHTHSKLQGRDSSSESSMRRK